jgi:hypothetical protein
LTGRTVPVRTAPGTDVALSFFCVPAPPVSFYQYSTGTGCGVFLPVAFLVRPRVPCVPCVSRLPRCLFTGILGASFSGYSGGRQRFVVDAGGWEVERVRTRLHFADRFRAGAGRRSVWSVCLCASACSVCLVCVPAPPGVFLPVPVARVCPGSPRCLFTGSVSVPAPPGVFLPVAFL